MRTPITELVAPGYSHGPILAPAFIQLSYPTALRMVVAMMNLVFLIAPLTGVYPIVDTKS